MIMLSMMMVMIMMLMFLVLYNFNNIHPLIVGMFLLILSILVTLQMNIFNKTSIFSMIMYLIVIGGFLVMFLYFNSFVLNLKMMFRLNSLVLFLFESMMLMILMYFLNKIDLFNYFLIDMKVLDKMEEGVKSNQYSVSKLYLKVWELVGFGMLYLFFVLVVVVKMIYFISPKSLRKMLYEI